MLVLTRKLQEKIRIGDDITITVLRTKGKAVRLGIEAPDDVPVIRGELAFDVSPAELTDEVRAAKSHSPAGSDRAGSRSRAPHGGWTTESHPHAGDRAEGNDSVEVSLRRVPRDQVVQALPKLVSGPRPLRGMRDARATKV